MKNVTVKCRNGIEYSLDAHGTKGEIHRLVDMFSNCCCYVCYNKDCTNPILGKQDCKNECELFISTPFCKPIEYDE